MFIDQSGTDRQVQGTLFRVYKFMDQSSTERQVKGSPVYFTHNRTSTRRGLVFVFFNKAVTPKMFLLSYYELENFHVQTISPRSYKGVVGLAEKLWLKVPFADLS